MNHKFKLFALCAFLSLITNPVLGQNDHDDHNDHNAMDNNKLHDGIAEHDELKGHDEHEEAEHGHDELKGHDEHEEAEHEHDELKGHDEHEEAEHEHDELKGHDEHEEAEHGHGAHEEAEGGVSLTSAQTTLANIQVMPLKAKVMDYQVYAPGEVKANGYTSYLVSPRVDSVVLKRHVALGDHVEKGQSLVTLFSETVAEAQASYRIASSEWLRVKKLSRKSVGDKRYVTAQAEHDAAYARLLAFGLSKPAIKTLSKHSQALGEYTLTAKNSGAVLSDDFRQGQRVESGEALMELADENVLWVEAQLAPTAQLELPAGTKAYIEVGTQRFQAKVSQEAHTIDPKTRTRVVRLLVNNEEHRLHPGLFADVYFVFETDKPVLAVPEEALMRGSDGDWVVFVEEHGEFKGQEIELGQSLGEWREIRGIAPGTNVVMQGAFYVSAEIAKGSFDAHNH